MKLSRRACALALSLAFATPTFATDLFVSPNGNDSNPGTIEQPFQTLEAARDHMRTLRAEGKDEQYRIVLRGGEYHRDRAWELTSEDSGTAEKPLQVVAYENEPVTLCGGVELGNWSRPTEEVNLGQLPEDVRGELWAAKLPDGFDANTLVRPTRTTPWEMVPAPAALYSKGSSLKLAQWPNQGWAKGTIQQVGDAWNFEADAASPEFTPNRFVKAHWLDAHGHRDDWMNIVDVNECTVRFEQAGQPLETEKETNVRLAGAVEFIDQPGEWAVTADGKYVVVWPRNESPEADWCLSQNETLVSLYGTSHVEFDGLSFQAARVMAIEVAGGEQVKVKNCSIDGIGNVAVHLFGGHSHVVDSCRISDTGEGAVRIEGGDENSLEPGKHAVENCLIEHYAQTGATFRPAIHLVGVGLRAEGNSISQGPHSAIILEGNEHLVAGNTIQNVCLDTEDVGAIWLGQCWTERGNVIAFNQIRDLGAGWQRFTVGVYLDDFASGTRVFGNFVSNASRGIVVAGGRDNQVDRNVVVDCKAGIHIDARGLHWAAEHVDHPESNLRRQLDERLQPHYVHTERYPELAEILDRNPGAPIGNSITGNKISCKVPVYYGKNVEQDHLKVVDNEERNDSKFDEQDYWSFLSENRDFASLVSKTRDNDEASPSDREESVAAE